MCTGANNATFLENLPSLYNYSDAQQREWW